MDERWAVVLAAGGSRRMGRPKALLDVDGRPLVARHVEAMRAAGARVRVVLGGHGEAVAAALPPGVEVRWNRDWARTDMRASLALGLADLPDAAPVLVTPVDAPPAPAEVLAALLRQGPPAVPAFAGRDGHPVLVRAGPARAALARAPLRDHLREAARVAVDWPDAVLNLNDPAAWAAWRSR